MGVGSRLRLLGPAVAPVLVVDLWYAKNAVQIGVFGSSSWLGMNLRRGWSISPEKPPEAPEEVQYLLFALVNRLDWFLREAAVEACALAAAVACGYSLGDAE